MTITIHVLVMRFPAALQFLVTVCHKLVFGQDDPIKKCSSLVADMEKILPHRQKGLW